jgi:hypothetical protein
MYRVDPNILLFWRFLNNVWFLRLILAVLVLKAKQFAVIF